MATLVLNLSGGNLHLDSLNLMIAPGGRKEFECSETELTAMCPELSTFKIRGRVRVSEDAILVETTEPPVQPSILELPPGVDQASLVASLEMVSETMQPPEPPEAQSKDSKPRKPKKVKEQE